MSLNLTLFIWNEPWGVTLSLKAEGERTATRLLRKLDR